MRELIQTAAQSLDLGQGEKVYNYTVTVNTRDALGEELLARWKASETNDFPNTFPYTLCDDGDFGVEDDQDENDRSEGDYQGVIMVFNDDVVEAARLANENPDDTNIDADATYEKYNEEFWRTIRDGITAQTYEGYNSRLSVDMFLYVLRHDAELTAEELLAKLQASPLVGKAAIVTVKLVTEPAHVQEAA